MNINKFTQKSIEAVNNCEKIAYDYGNQEIDQEHFLYSLMTIEDSLIANLIEKMDINKDTFIKNIETLLSQKTKVSGNVNLYVSNDLNKVLVNAEDEAKRMGDAYVSVEHLMLAMIAAPNKAIKQLFKTYGITRDKFLSVLATVRGNQSVNSDNPEATYDTLNKYGQDLVEKAKEGKLDPVIGREEEINRVIQILSRRTKNNPCLIGEPGVGKTAIAEGLAAKIIEGNVPETIKDKRLLTLDLSGMVAGSKYRGEFEERIKKVISEVKAAGNILLFLDELHTIIGAGGAEGAIDASNILKPSLARGEIQLIGATTLEEYRKYIEKDSALERRFSPVTVNEPSEKDTVLILKGIRDKYEAHHNVKITDEAIEAAVKLSVRYVTDRFLPDKAIDLIDEASSKARLKTYTEPDSLKELQEEIEKTKNEKEEAVLNQKFEKAAELRDAEKALREKFEKEQSKWKNKNTKSIVTITEENIAEVIANWTGIPAKKITEDENEKLKNLEKELHKRVIGQNEAVEAVSKAIRRSRVGLKDPKRPIGSFLFLGPTGVGKTELSKALAEVLFGDENAMIRLDMSEFMEPHSVSKLIGAPPGYVGFDDGGQLTEKIRRKPYSVILFDEIEKAHPDVMNMLLQILEDGRLTDSQGRTVNFKNTVIIMTSNLGARLITDRKQLGFANQVATNKTNENSESEAKNSKELKENISQDKNAKKEYEEIKKEVMAELKKELRPEFINRIDEIIVFHKLNDNDINQIIDIMLKGVVNRLKEQKYEIEFEPDVKEMIAKEGIDKNFGARPLRRTIQNLIEDKLAEEILDGKLEKGKVNKITVRQLRVN